MLAVDDRVGYILVKTGVFSQIAPNMVSVCSLILNIAILCNVISRGSPHITTALIIVRLLTDILDGNIARHYDKGTLLGGFLDTLGDAGLYGFVLPYIITERLSPTPYLPMLIGGVCMCVYLLYMVANNTVVDHSRLKNGGTCLEDMGSFLVNNTLVTALPVLICINYIAFIWFP